MKRAPAMRWLAQSGPVHSLLYAGETFTGTDTEVIADRTAVTGISWGGYTTCLVASLDDRFTAAVPVYDCGFLHEGESVQKPSIDALGDQCDAWVKAYDPSSLLPHCRVPILWVNGTRDEIRLAFESAVPVKSATLHYTTDPGLRSNREWKSLPARIGEANTWFIALTDERGAIWLRAPSNSNHERFRHALHPAAWLANGWKEKRGKN